MGIRVFVPTSPVLPAAQNHLCVFGGMDAGGVIKEQDYFTSLLDAREGRWHKRAIAVDPNLSGDYHGAILGLFKWADLIGFSRSYFSVF
jgi:hypothetical protein